MAKLAWIRLLNNECPKCGEQLQYFGAGDMLMCSILCGFTVKHETARKIIAKKKKEEYVPGPAALFETPIEAVDSLGNDFMYGYEEDE